MNSRARLPTPVYLQPAFPLQLSRRSTEVSLGVVLIYFASFTLDVAALTYKSDTATVHPAETNTMATTRASLEVTKGGSLVDPIPLESSTSNSVTDDSQSLVRPFPTEEEWATLPRVGKSCHQKRTPQLHVHLILTDTL